MSQKTYAELLAELKVAQGKAERLDMLRAKAQQVCRDIKADLSGIPLVDAGVVVALLEAKLREDGFENVQYHSRAITGPALFDTNEHEYLASATVGEYPKHAYNVGIVCKDDAVIVYYNRVPESGNPR